MKDKIFGVDNRLQWDVSREVGGKFQIGSEQTVREITQEIETFVKPAQRCLTLMLRTRISKPYYLISHNDSPQARSKIRMDQVKSYITEKLSAKDADAFEQYYYWSKRNSVDAMEAYTGVRNEAMLTNQFLHSRLTPAAKERKGIEISEFDDLELPVDPATPGKGTRTSTLIRPANFPAALLSPVTTSLFCKQTHAV